jgi:hypothetical protein
MNVHVSRALLVFAGLAALAALPLPAAAGGGTVYGKGVSGAKPVTVAELLSNPAEYVGKTVRVEGTVSDVCPMAGCWMNLADPKGERTVRIKVTDGEIVFPVTAKGRPAVAEGLFTRIEITKDQALERAKHEAEERGETFDAAKAGALPTVFYQIQGTGAVIQ